MDWRHVQDSVRKHCRVSELTRHTGLALLLGGLGTKLELVARGVMEYLDVKRAGFPRCAWWCCCCACLGRVCSSSHVP